MLTTNPSGLASRAASLTWTRWSVALIALAASAAMAGTSLTYRTNTDADIVLESWLEGTPPSGLIPMVIKATNHSNQPLQWTLECNDEQFDTGSMRRTFTFGAAAKSSSETSVLVPVCPSDSTSHRYSNMRLTVAGPAIAGGSATNYLTGRSPTSSSGKSFTEFIARSNNFNGKHGTAFNHAITTTLSRDLQGSEVSIAQAPTDWRGYSSLASLWMVEADWTLMSPQQHNALLTWVAHGGTVVICSDSPTPTIKLPDGFPPITASSYRLGHGQIHTGLFTESRAAALVASSGGASKPTLMGRSGDPNQSLSSLIPGLELNGKLIFAFMLIFGVIVGPVNLFWFARGANRPRMFWTTPLISLAGTAVLILVMILQDGVGGTGARVSLALVLPEQKMMTVLQEQFSKTGILLARDFNLPASDSIVLDPVPADRLVRISSRGFASPLMDKRNYRLGDTTASDGWFTSRAIQGQVLEATRSTRGGIEFTAGDSPTLLSSLGANLKTVFVQDAQKNVWTAATVRTGERTALKRSTREELKNWWLKTALSKGGELMRERGASLVENESQPWFFAEADEPSKIAIPTLESIKWIHDHAVIAGPWISSIAKPTP